MAAHHDPAWNGSQRVSAGGWLIPERREDMIDCPRCGLPISPGVCAPEPHVFHDRPEQCVRDLKKLVASLTTVAKNARGMLVGLDEKERIDPHDGMWLHYRVQLIAAMNRLPKEMGMAVDEWPNRSPLLSPLRSGDAGKEGR